jgi:Flp pilus assembly protein TadG
MAVRKATRGSRGYVLVALTLALVFLLSICGLAIDVGRMYITKSEAQSFVDSAALAAAQKLDGSENCFDAAMTAVTNDPKRWRFDNTAFSGEQVTFATSPSGPWVTTAYDPAGYVYVRVQVSVSLSLYLIKAVAGAWSTIAASAVAGRVATTTLPSGVFPFSPYTRSGSPDNPSDPYGYQIGNQYTLRWGAPGTRSDCGTDPAKETLDSNGAIRGYCCAGSAASIRDAIVTGHTAPLTLAVNSSVPMDNAAKNTEMPAIAQRVDQDSDTTSETYEEYLNKHKGNGERVVVVPVNGGGPNYLLQGFAGFFLLPDSEYSGLKGNDSACAEYIGAWVQGIPMPQPGGSGAYHLKLFQ